MSSSLDGVWRRIALRFSLVLALLVMFPFPIGSLPKTEWLSEMLYKPLEWLNLWLAEHVFGVEFLPTWFNGSGDRSLDYVSLAMIASLSAIATAVWFGVDRRREHPRFTAFVRTLIRYSLAVAMLSYGVAKVVKSQFPDVSPAILEERIGDASPMGLLWTFMGYSKPYTVFAGLAEMIGGALLIWRQTATLGALLVAGVMTNVVMLNFCYDVPVKIYSTQLLVFALVTAWPRLRRVLAAAMGYAASEEAPQSLWAPRWERRRRIAKVILVLGLFAGSVMSVSMGRNEHVHELYGRWQVKEMRIDGVERPGLLGDGERWRLAAFNAYSLWLFSMVDEPEVMMVTVDAEKHALDVKLVGRRGKYPPKDPVKETWSYAHPMPDQLVIDGTHRGKKLHVVLQLAPDGLLSTRGFNWVNEFPLNR